MNSELIVDVSAKEISMALLEDQRLVELQRERRDLAFAVGDIYLGRVKEGDAWPQRGIRRCRI